MAKAQRVSVFRTAIEKIEEEQKQDTINIISLEEPDSSPPPVHEKLSVSVETKAVSNHEPEKFLNIVDVFNEKLNTFLVSLIRMT